MRCLLAPLLIAALLSPAPAAADVLGKRLSLAFGGFRNTLSLQGRVDDALIEGTQFDFGEQFDFNSQRVIDLAELRLRPFPRHEFGVKAFRDTRRARARLSEPLRFRGETFLVDAEALARADLRSLEFDYTWWAWVQPDQALGIQLGALRFGVSLSVQGRVAVAGEGEAEASAAIGDRLFVPLLGLAWRRQLGQHWRLEGDLRYLRRSYRGIEGEAVSARLGAEWLLGRRLSLLVSYGHTEVDLAQDKIDFAGALKVGFRGPQAMLRLRF